MTKYGIPDDHEWADEKEEEAADLPPAAEVSSHSVEIVHRAHDTQLAETDIRYRFVFQDGEAIGILRSHRIAESSQFDPMGAADPFQVPGVVRDRLAEEMGADHWTDAVDTDRAATFAEPSP